MSVSILTKHPTICEILNTILYIDEDVYFPFCILSGIEILEKTCDNRFRSVTLNIRHDTGFNKHSKFILNNKQGILEGERKELIQTINYKN